MIGKQKVYQFNITFEDLLSKKKQQQRKDTDVSFYTLIDSNYDRKDLTEMIKEKMAAEAKVSKAQRKQWLEDERALTEKHQFALQYLNTSQLLSEDKVQSTIPNIDQLWQQLSQNLPPFNKTEFEMNFKLYLSSKTRDTIEMNAHLVIGLFLKWEQDYITFMNNVQKGIISSDVPLNLRKFIMTYAELFYIQDLYLQVPIFMDIMMQFEIKYHSNTAERYYFRMILKKRSLIFKIKLFIEKQIQQGKVLNDRKSLLTEFKRLLLGKSYFVDKGIVQKDNTAIYITDWSDTRQALQIIGEKLRKQMKYFKPNSIFLPKPQIDQPIKQLSTAQTLEQKAQIKPKKKKKKPAPKIEDKKQEQQDKMFDQLSDFLEKLQINDQERIQLRLDEEWTEKFLRKIPQQTKPKIKKENFMFKNFGNYSQKKY